MEPLEVRRREYQRHRDARVALIRCAECNEYYETSVRQARRIRNGENRRLCETCRILEAAAEGMPDRTEEFALWWQEESCLSPEELGALVSQVCPEEVRALRTEHEPVVSPSRRLPLEEGNHSNGAAALARVHISGLGQLVSTSAA